MTALPRIALVVSCAVLAGCGAATSPPPTPPPVTAAPRVTVPAAVDIGPPTRVVIDAIGVDEPLVGVGLQADGSMETPAFGGAGWYDLGPRPGAPGPAVVLAHVRGPDGPDVFARLAELRPGDVVVVHRTDGATSFVVEGAEQVPKESLPYDRIWFDDVDPVLRLITCGGTPGPHGFPDNTVVYLRSR